VAGFDSTADTLLEGFERRLTEAPTIHCHSDPAQLEALFHALNYHTDRFEIGSDG
jgi:hypothetical protein